MNKKTILVIGGAGFIGSNLIRYISYNTNDYKIISIDKLSQTNSIHNVYLNKNHEFYLCNVNDEHILERIFEIHKPNYVINLCNDDNISYVNVLNDFSYRHCIDKFIHISYFLYKNQTTENEEILCSKICTKEQYNSFCIESFLKSNLCNLNYNILRCPDCFGPREQKTIIPNIFLSCILNKQILLKNKGLNIKDLLYVEDLCNAIYTILNSPNKQIYNVSCNLDYTELELSSYIIDLVKEAVKNNKIVCDLPDLKLDNFIENNDIIKINCDKIKSLGWKPQRKIKENLKYTLNWYISNKWFFNLI